VNSADQPGDRGELQLPPDAESAAAAVAALQSQLQLADGNLDALDRKAALLPAFLAALAGLFLDPDSILSGLGLVSVLIALAAGIVSVGCALNAMRARAHVSGADVDDVMANLDLPIRDFNAALAGSLAWAINNATDHALHKGRWLNRAMAIAVVTILFLSLSRLAGVPDDRQANPDPSPGSSSFLDRTSQAG